MAAYTAIDDPSAYFKVQLYTGNGSANHAITFNDTDTDMQPNIVWIKNRDQADGHCLFDSVRGATKLLDVSTADAETTDTDTLDSFTSDGFQVDADVKVNTDTEDYVAWCWKESATAGLDIITYTGTGSTLNVAHNLSAVPHFIMLFNRGNAARNHYIYHQNLTDDSNLKLDTTVAESTYSAGFIDAPTSSNVVVSSGGGGVILNVNITDDSYLLYVFAEKQGFSKFGSFVGNSNVDGPMIVTGMRPAWVMIKRIDVGDHWNIHDNKRVGYNVDNNYLQADTTAAEATTDDIDILSNGLKIRRYLSGFNTAGVTYLYMAFAQAPFVNSEGVPVNAR